MKKNRSTNRIIVMLVLSLIAVGAAGCGTEETTQTTAGTTQTETQTVQKNYEGVYEGAVESLAYSQDGSMLAVGSFMKVELLDSISLESIRSTELSHAAVDIGFSADDQVLGVALQVGGVRLLSVSDLIEKHQLHQGFDNVLSFSPQNNLIATGNRNGEIWLWDIETGEQEAAYVPTDTDFLSALVYTPDGQRVISGDYSGMVYVWAVDETGKPERVVDDEYIIINDLAVSPDGEILAISTLSRRSIDLIRLSDGSIAASTTESLIGRSLSFSPDGSWLAAGGADGILYIWDTNDWTLVDSLEHMDEEGDADRLNCVVFSPDSRQVAVGTASNAIHVWDLT